MEMDVKDANILSELLRDSRQTTGKLSKKLHIPITTIHNRIKKLVKEGIIKKYTVELDHDKLGKKVAAYIHITVDYKFLKEKKLTQHDLSRKLKQFENVEEVAMLTGESDIIIKVREKDVHGLDFFVTKQLRNIEGIDKTRTAVVLHEF